MVFSTFFKTIRDHRWGALGWGLGLGVLLPITGWAWAHAYPDQHARELIANTIENGGLSIVGVFYGEPRRIDTVGGVIAWRGLGLYPVMLGIYAVLLASGATRGAEERGDLEVALATPASRGRLFAEQAIGLLGVLAIVVALVWAGIVLSGLTWHKGLLNAGDAALACLNLLTSVAMFGAVTLLAAQFVRSSRAAALTGGVLLVAAHIWNNLAFVVPAIERARPISPLYLYSRSSPLATGHFDVAAWAALALITAAITYLAGALFLRRDIRDVATFSARVPAFAHAPALPWLRRWDTWLLSSVSGRGLRSVLGVTVVWGLSLGAYAALFAALDRSAVDAFRNQPGIQDLLERLGRASLATDTGFIGLALFSFLPALVAIYGVTLASSWASEESNGWMELEMTCPVSRRRYYLSRLVASALAVLLAVAMLGLLFLVACLAAGLDLPVGRTVAAVVLLAPLAIAVLTLGYAVSIGRPAAVGAITGALVGVSFFLYVLAPLFNAPHFIRDLSIFQLYGQPLIDGVDWVRSGLLCLVAILLGAYGAIGFERKDITK